MLHIQLENFFLSVARVRWKGFVFRFYDSTRDFVGFSFLVSGNLESISRVKSLEEISYFDGDASAVTADLSNNVDVNFSFDFGCRVGKVFLVLVQNNFRFIIMVRMSCQRCWSESSTKIPSRKVTFHSPSCRWWLNHKKARESCSSFSENANLKKNPPSLISRKFTLRTCVGWIVGWESFGTLAIVYRSSTSGKVRATINLDFDDFSILWQVPTANNVANKDSSASSRTKVTKLRFNFMRFLHIKASLPSAIIDALGTFDCSCLKDCNEIQYSKQSSNTMFWFHNSRVSWTLTQTKVIFKRELIHGFVEALVSTGADLSLCLGMSCLTFVEVFFFVYLRLKLWMQRKFSEVFMRWVCRWIFK